MWPQTEQNIPLVCLCMSYDPSVYIYIYIKKSFSSILYNLQTKNAKCHIFFWLSERLLLQHPFHQHNASTESKAWKSQWDEALARVRVPLLLLLIIWKSRPRNPGKQSKPCSVSHWPRCVIKESMGLGWMKMSWYPRPSLKFTHGVIADKIWKKKKKNY